MSSREKLIILQSVIWIECIMYLFLCPRGQTLSISTGSSDHPCDHVLRAPTNCLDRRCSTSSHRRMGQQTFTIMSQERRVDHPCHHVPRFPTDRLGQTLVSSPLHLLTPTQWPTEACHRAATATPPHVGRRNGQRWLAIAPPPLQLLCRCSWNDHEATSSPATCCVTSFYRVNPRAPPEPKKREHHSIDNYMPHNFMAVYAAAL
jgi:hypothetical protein